MSLLIKNGDIVTADSRQAADIYIEDETITRIGTGLEAPPDAEVINASGRYVFPGFIDPNAHIYLPFMGTFSKDSHTTGSQAALVGGTTTFIEMCAPLEAGRRPRRLRAVEGEGRGEQRLRLRLPYGRLQVRRHHRSAAA